MLPLLFGTVACGTQLTHSEILADARISGQSAAASVGQATEGSGGQAGPLGAVGSGPTAGGSSSASGGVTGGSALGSSGTSSGASGSAGSTGSAGSAGSTSSSGGAASASSSAACSGSLDPVIIGTVGEQSGLAGSAIAQGAVAVQAWVSEIDAGGGLACHPVKYIVLDDGGDPSRNQALVQQLVEQDHAIAVVYENATLAGSASINYLTSKRIPVIGSDTADPWMYQSPMFFPQGASSQYVYAAMVAAVSSVGRPLGDTTIGTLDCIEVGECSSAAGIVGTYAPKFGLQYVYKGNGSLVEPDYTSVCQGAKAAGAKIFLLSLDPNSVDRAGASCASINYHPLYVTISAAVPADVLTNASLSGIVASNPVIPWFDTANPGVKEMLGAINKYAPGLQLPGSAGFGWVSAKLFQAAAVHLSNPPTSQDILNGLWSLKNDDLGGLTQPLTFTQGQNANPNPICYWTLQVTGAQWTSPNGNQRTCFAPAG